MRPRVLAAAVPRPRLAPAAAAWLLLLAGAALLWSAWVRAEEPPPTPLDPSEELVRLFEGETLDSVADLQLMQEHVQALTAEVSPCVVGVIVGPAQGSGVVISEDGYVLTAAHVNGEPGRDVVFIFPDGSQKQGKTLGINRTLDAGLMKITDQGKYAHVEMGSSADVTVGQWCLAVGHPGGYQADRGLVVRLGRVLRSRSNLIMSDCTLVGGDSGGPLFDMQGRVIGIHSRIGPELTSNLHVPVDEFRDSWDRLVRSEAWGGDEGASGPYLGVRGDPNADDVRILEVFPDSPAEKAGLQADDVILRINGKKVDSFPELGEQIRELEVGDEVALQVRRGEDVFTLRLKLGRRGEEE